ncbi:MAG: histidinol dehydrogenase [Ekhidna sp.]|nr:histidinol dehydrogenase [Ekhidna sp.]
MKFIKNPSKGTWDLFCKRPGLDVSELETAIATVFSEVKEHGDQALLDFTKRFDKVEMSRISIDLTSVEFSINPDLQKAIKLAKSNIETFHNAQKEIPQKIETQEGVTCWRKNAAIQNVGLYIPGGSAALFSTLLMLAIPAKIAGCRNIVVCTPPSESGSIHEVIGWTCQLLSIDKVYLTGGAQAIAAMALGTETLPKTDKIFGPGNQYVTTAKQMAQKYGVAIDIPAGPSEILVIADDSANPAFVAADLLSQAEHGPDSQVVLVSNSKTLISSVENEVKNQVEDLPRKETALQALENSIFILIDSIEDCIDFSNTYAPEHLIMAVKDAEALSDKITTAGSVFLGNWSCESAGDYASGTNHTLPTNGYARSHSGVSLDSFVKKITFQKLSEEGIRNLGPSIETMAEAEQLQAHKNAVALRLKALQNV